MLPLKLAVNRMKKLKPGNRIKERLSAVIEFEDEIEFKGFKGKYGVVMGRWENQKWETKGVVLVYVIKNEISDADEMTQENSCWMESHASYETISG